MSLIITDIMQNQHKNKNIYDIKDASKGQKIAAALYLVTNHLSDNDPLKAMIRQYAVALVGEVADQRALGRKICNLLSAAALGNMISEQNVLILSTEISHYVNMADDLFGTLFVQTDHNPDIKSLQIKAKPQMSVMTDSLSLNNNHHKSKRQEQILSFINDRKSAGIKDISLLFSDVSEKTIQRELINLVEQGKITKRGSKRWSIYMAVV